MERLGWLDSAFTSHGGWSQGGEGDLPVVPEILVGVGWCMEGRASESHWG